MQINVSVTDANNIVCEVVPPQPQVIVIDRGVEGNGIVSIVPVTISTFQYLRITYTNGTVQDVGPLTSTAYTATAPITIVGNTISLATVPIASGGTDATTAAGAIQNLLPSYTGNANKRLGLNSLATALEWVADGGGTVTSIDASGGTTGLSFTGGPITSSGTLTLTGTLAIANGGTGQTSANAAFNALAPSQTGNSGKYLTTNGTDTSWATNPLGTVTSVAATVPSFLSVSGSPITTSGTLAFSLSGTALPTTSGGTGLTSFTSGGVVYASSTSALTTGSALTFDGSRLLLGTTSPQGKFTIDAGGAAGIYLTSATGGSVVDDFKIVRTAGSGGSIVGSNTWVQLYNLTDNNGSGFQTYQGGSIFWGNSSGTWAEQMRLVTGGKLAVNPAGSGSGVKLNVTGGGSGALGAVLIGDGDVSGSTNYWNIGRDNAVSGAFTFAVNGSEKIRINTSGEFLVGCTGLTGDAPNALGSTYQQDNGNTKIRVAADLQAAFQFYSVTGGTTAPVGNIAVGSSSVSYFTSSGNSGFVGLDANTLGFVTSGSEQARITSGGNFGVGTSSPSSKFQVSSTNNTTYSSTNTLGSGSVAYIQNASTTSGTAGTLRLETLGPVNAAVISISAVHTSDGAAAITFGNRPNGGSDVLERLRIDTSGNLGLGTPNPSGASGLTFAINGGGNQTRIALKNSSTGDASGDGFQMVLDSGGLDVGFEQRENASIRFSTNNTEALRILNNQNVGIGTSSPQVRLTLRTTHAAPTGTTYTGALLIHDEPNGVAPHLGAGVAYDGGGNYGWIQVNSSGGTYPLVLQGVGGNVGIGTTLPSEKLHVVTSTTYAATFNTTVTSASSTRISIGGLGSGAGGGGGTSAIGNSTNHSTTAQSSLTFHTHNGSTLNEVGRFDPLGNLGIGTSAPAFRLDTATAGAVISGTATIGSNMYGMRIANTTSATANNAVGLWFSTGPHQAGIASFRPTPDTDWATALAFYTHGAATSGLTDCYERMRVDGSGNLLVGRTDNPGSSRANFYGDGGTTIRVGDATNSAWRGYVMGAGGNDSSEYGFLKLNANSGELKLYVGPNTYGGFQTFYTAGLERARIDGSGRLLVGTTTNNFSSRVVSFSDSSYTYESQRTGTGSEGHIAFVNANGAVGTIFTSGSSTSYNTSSDYRLKNITGALTGYKERLMSLQPKQGTWKSDGSEFRGFLAHEFAQPYSASVIGEKDAVDEDGKPIMQSMQASSSEVMADLVAMVNELITENASLKARLDAANL